MRVNKIESMQVQDSTQLTYLHTLLDEKADHKQGSKAPNTDENINLRRQILAIQRAKAQLGIENLAASDLDGVLPGLRRRVALWLGSPPYRWGDFLELEFALGSERMALTSSGNVTVAITWAMAEIAEHATPKHLSYEYSSSNLMHVAVEEPPYGWTSYCQGSENARINAAIALRHIIEKIGNSLPDEAEIIRLLLSAPTLKVREQGAIAAANTYKHSWRQRIQDTGLIRALKQDRDDEVRKYVASAIAHANPLLILKEYPVVGSSPFIPLTRLLEDSIQVKTELAMGLCRLLEAEKKYGNYYEDFKEVLEPSPQNKIDCFSHALKLTERLYRRIPLSSDERFLFYWCLILLRDLINDKVIDFVKYSSVQLYEYRRLIQRLSNFELSKFLEAAYVDQLKDDEKRNEGNFLLAREAALPIINMMVSTVADSHERPLVYYFGDMKGAFNQAKEKAINAQTFEVAAALSDASDRIANGGVENYITEVNGGRKKINWGSHSEFNLTVANLLNCFEHSSKDSLKLAILELFSNLDRNGLVLDDLGQVTLGHALSSENKDKQKQILRAAIYSKDSLIRGVETPTAKAFFLSPSTTTIFGKALTLYRNLTGNSFKDYLRLPDLKSRAVEMAVSCVVGSGFSRGFLLAGPRGTGKTLFANVLANELALPLELFVMSSVQEQDGKLFFKDDSGTYELSLYLERYFNKLKTGGPCVMLVDDIGKITGVESASLFTSLTQFLEKLKAAHLPVFVIGTSNYPSAKSVKGMKIDEYGSSKEIDQVLSQEVHPDLFNTLQPCYVFHKRELGPEFTREFLEGLVKSGDIEGPIDINLALRFVVGLSPAKIVSSLSKPSENGKLTEREIIERIKNLKTESDDGTLSHREGFMRTKIEDLVIDKGCLIEGPIDCLELAIITEDMSNESITQILNNTTSVLNQSVLLKLFSDAAK